MYFNQEHGATLGILSGPLGTPLMRFGSFLAAEPSSVTSRSAPGWPRGVPRERSRGPPPCIPLAASRGMGAPLRALRGEVAYSTFVVPDAGFACHVGA